MPETFEGCWGTAPAGPVEVEPFTRVTLPACLYRHPRKLTLRRAIVGGRWRNLLRRLLRRARLLIFRT